MDELLFVVVFGMKYVVKQLKSTALLGGKGQAA